MVIKEKECIMDTERLIGTEANRHAVILVNNILKMKNDGNTLDEKANS